MSQTIRNVQALLLPCLVIALTGCQHPMPQEVAVARPAPVNRSLYDTGATVHLQKVMFTTGPAVNPVASVAEVGATDGSKPAPSPDANAPKEQPSLTLQLGDCLVSVLKTITGH